jgi:hypothetical protein
MSIFLRVFICVSGAIFLYTVFKDLVLRKLTERQSLFWIMLSIVLMLLGIFPGITKRVADVFDVEYAPSIIFTLTLLVSISGVYKCFRANAELENRVNELAIQISMLNQEQSEMLRKDELPKDDRRVLYEDGKMIHMSEAVKKRKKRKNNKQAQYKTQ